MIVALSLLLSAGQAAAPPAAPPLAPPSLAAEWAGMPPLRFRRPPELPATVGAFAQGEVAAGRCAAPHGHALHVELAVLVGAGGALRVVPRAMGCATVEQYASGLVSRFARDNLEPDGDEGWHVTSVNFVWP